MKLRLLLCAVLLLGSTLLPTAAHAATSDTFSAATIITLANTDRARHALSPLADSALLDAAAQAKADDMVASSYFAHYSPSGISPWHWFTLAGYSYTHAGENLAINFTDSGALEAAWMASPAHRANILKSIYTETGVGVAHGAYLGSPAVFIVELFATPAHTNPAL